MNALRRFIQWLRDLSRRRGFAHWDLKICEAEWRDSALRFNLDSEDEVLLLHGEPTLIEECPQECLDADGNIICRDGCHWLIYDRLLRRTRVMFHIVDGRVEGSALLPKLKRCPPDVRDYAPTYYSPHENGS